MSNLRLQLYIQDTVNKRKYLKKKDVLILLNYIFKKKTIITIRIVNANESKKLNNNFRKINSPTNVLSFLIDNKPLIGDLILCHEIIKNEAKEQKKRLYDHYTHLIIHGCLHLLGYDHDIDSSASLMENKEIKILKKIGIKNPYIQNA